MMEKENQPITSTAMVFHEVMTIILDTRYVEELESTELCQHMLEKQEAKIVTVVLYNGEDYQAVIVLDADRLRNSTENS
ncbi:hypothetical protein, partial [Oenococcus oeni]|uniref:hypothetical protein n=1 Tax=Oenococcus oeni TaxID=1247 RepID=UPI00117DF08C